jgi:chromosomal replication initiator protein
MTSEAHVTPHSRRTPPEPQPACDHTRSTTAIITTTTPAGDDDLGRRVRSDLTEQIGEQRIARLLGARAAIRCEGDHLEVRVPDRFSAERIERSIGDELRRTAGRIIPGRDVRVRVDDAVAEEHPHTANTPAPSASSASSASGTQARSTQPRRQPVPEFIVGHANRVAYEAVRRAACEPDAPNLIFIHGPCGVGKTHLVRWAAAMARRARPDARIRVTSGELFISGYVNAIQNHTVPEFQKRHRRLDLLVIHIVQRPRRRVVGRVFNGRDRRGGRGGRDRSGGHDGSGR